LARGEVGGGLPAAEVVVEVAEFTVQELLWPSALETGVGAGTLGIKQSFCFAFCIFEYPTFKSWTRLWTGGIFFSLRTRLKAMYLA